MRSRAKAQREPVIHQGIEIHTQTHPVGSIAMYTIHGSTQVTNRRLFAAEAIEEAKQAIDKALRKTTSKKGVNSNGQG